MVLPSRNVRVFDFHKFGIRVTILGTTPQSDVTLATRSQLETAAKDWSQNGLIRLTESTSNVYSGQIESLLMTRVSGAEDRYSFILVFTVETKI